MLWELAEASSSQFSIHDLPVVWKAREIYDLPEAPDGRANC